MNPEDSQVTGAGDAVGPVSPEVKNRLMREAAELATAENEFSAHPTKTNLLEWHFTIKGPELEQRIYQGRIIFPKEYPMKPPSFILLTPNGRFHAICLSISNYHPETWLTSWSIRTALVALRSFLLTPGNEGAIGSINYANEKGKKLAIKSRHWSCQECDPVIKLLSVRNPDGSNSAKEAENNDADAVPTFQATVGPPNRKTSAKMTATQNGHAKDCNNCNPVTSSSTALLNMDNQDVTSARSEEINKFTPEQQVQHNEHIKHILGDFAIGCFIIVFIGASFCRLLTIFTQGLK
ncbi:Ubiquitin-conjugating enzyme E2 J1 [Orchesella cincta]|uniref:Ubiquitin-conjugating enzyme E2 J1 n=1 Tax=Orchesella cincta TaxID=48709 RepID=A0A1D2NJV7_ORCCI|nr:Ubiquitin-conjugating enzyme E2 J1 [Orchesella cincta]